MQYQHLGYSPSALSTLVRPFTHRLIVHVSSRILACVPVCCKGMLVESSACIITFPNMVSDHAMRPRLVCWIVRQLVLYADREVQALFRVSIRLAYVLRSAILDRLETKEEFAD